MMRPSTAVIAGLQFIALAAGQVVHHAAAQVHVPAVEFPLRHGYTRLHPDRVTVLDPRFDTHPDESMKILVVYSGDAVMPYDPIANKPLWSAPLVCALEPTLLMLDDKRLIFATSTQVICVDRSSGAQRWRVGDKTSTNPEDDPEWQASLIDFAYAADRLICANDRRELMCVNTNDGSIAWRVSDGPRNPGVLVADSQFVVSYDENAAAGSLTCRRLETGEKFKAVPYDRRNTPQFVQKISEPQLLAVTSSELTCFNSGSLALNWRVAGRPLILFSTLLIDGNNVFVSDDGKTLTRYLAETGERRWRSTRLATGNDGILWTVSAGPLILAATPRVIGAFDAGNGRRQWRRTDSQFTHEQSPVLIHDALLTFGRPALPTRPDSQPAATQPIGLPLILRRLNLVDGSGGDAPASTFITESLQSFGGVCVRDHAIIVLDGNRLIGYVDATVKSRP